MANENLTVIIFGGTGDLARRKLVPAFFNLYRQGQLPDRIKIVGIGRKKINSSDYRRTLGSAVAEYSPKTWDDDRWVEFAPSFEYFSMDVEDSDSYSLLKDYLSSSGTGEKEAGHYLFFLALAPELFENIAANMGTFGLTGSRGEWRRIMIEKPFGSDLETARRLNRVLCASFSDENIYRVDHYLGKEMLQNILVIRFANSVFEPLWNACYIDHVQITVAEDEGIGTRGAYYDRTGAMRDMIQSHLLQMLAVVAMEPPEPSDPDKISTSKLDIINALSLWPSARPEENVVFAQYRGYDREDDVAAGSSTETFAALKLAINNQRWKGVPFYIRTGKKLLEKQARITIQFKKPVINNAGFIKASNAGEMTGDLLNLLTLKVQPQEGVVFQFNIKKPATVDQIVPATMDFCQPCAFLINTREAYEHLLADAIKGDPARFSSWPEIESSWAIIDHLYAVKSRIQGGPYLYEPGSWGPREGELLLGQNGRRWWS